MNYLKVKAPPSFRSTLASPGPTVAPLVPMTLLAGIFPPAAADAHFTKPVTPQLKQSAAD